MAMHISDEGNIFTPKAEPLRQLLGDIHLHKTALPNFQRPWVWEPQMVRDLLVSVAYRYPAGSLLTMPVTGPTFALRAFDGSGELPKGQHANLMVLDGQQRLTSLYQALYRQEGVQYKGRRFHFYLDIPTLMTDPAGTPGSDPLFSDALFFVRQEKTGRRVRYDGLQPRYELTTRKHELEAGCLPLNILFDSDALGQWKKQYLVQLSDNDMTRYLALDEQWDSQVKPWLDRIRGYPFPVVELRADMPLGAICHIFEKVNSTGVPLDVFDLCTAIYWAKGFYLNEEWAATRRKLEQAYILAMQPLSGTYFLQGLSLLDSIDRKRANPTGRIAVACRKEDLMALPVESVQRWWDALVEGYKEASKFMTNEGILSERILPYTTLILPLSAMFADLIQRKGKAHVGAAWPKVSQWYWCSVFSQRYSSQLDSAAAQDFEQMMAWVDGTAGPPDVVRTFNFRPEALQEIASIRNAVYKGVLCLLARQGAKDFGGGGKLTTALFYDTQQDHHHIFPTAAMAKMGIKDSRVDTIINKTLINSSVNRSIGDRRPSEYTQTLSKQLGADLFDDILTTHAILPGLLRQDNWQEFVLDRRERLRQLIADACGVSIQPFAITASDAVEDEAIFESDDEDVSA